MVSIRSLALCLAVALTTPGIHAGASRWIRPASETDPLVWGHRDGLVFGLPSPGGMPGPRGLIRVGILRDGHDAPDLINFLAFEPVVAGHKGLSELEESRLDGVRGKRLSVVGPREGAVEGDAAQGEALLVTVDCEPFSNGARVRAELRVLADAPEELQVRLLAAEGSAPMEEATVTATMGNYGRLRRVTLRDQWLDSRALYEGYEGDAFVEKRPFRVDRLPRLPSGDVLVAAVSDEADPATVSIPSPRWWQYRSIPLTQTWRVPAREVGPDLRLRLNGRRLYWQSRREIPGGIAFENFELRSRFADGQTFIFGLWRRSPRELGVDPDAPVAEGSTAAWQHPLYLDGGGVWRQRVAVTIANGSDRDLKGFPVSLRVGTGEGELRLAGARAESLRATTDAGVELLLDVRDPHGAARRHGPIPQGATLTLPALAGSSETATVYVYLDNPAAGIVPDVLEGRTSILNGGVEDGEGDTPTGWRHDPPDEDHRALWVSEEPHSGERCLKTVVSPDAEATWIATRQGGIRILGGVRYELRAWVRAEDVKGFAGWYAHVGNEETSMLSSPMLSGGPGTYGWKEVRATIDTPPEATILSLGTVLRGTGTAWFDDAQLDCESTPPLRASAGPVEKLRLTEVDRTPSLLDGEQVPEDAVSATVRIVHLGATPLERTLVSADASEILGKARRFGRPMTARLAGRDAPLGILGGRLLFEARIPAGSRVSIPVVFEEGAAGSIETPEGYRALLESPANLVGDPSFELAGARAAWTRSSGGRGIQVERVEGGLFGQRCGCIHVEESATPAWSGWRQDVTAEPGGTYLYAAWVRTEDVRDGTALLHAHLLARDGSLSKSQGFASAGPSLSGTQPWTLLSGVFTLPEDVTTFQVHLTVLARGTVWHDGGVVARLLPGTVGPAGLSRGRESEGGAEIRAWPVPSVVKVFDDDAPPLEAPRARIALARGEAETLQLAVRGSGSTQRIRIDLSPPRNPAKASLDDVQIHVVGTVPIDHPTNYYRSDRAAWERRIPRGQAGSDGWPGRWPDPLLPTRALDLEPGRTRALWITVRAPAGTPSGTYRGAVRLLAEDESLLEVPFSVEVWDFTLPEERHVGAIYDVRLHGDAWSLPGQSEEDVRVGFWRFLSERRLCPDRIQPEPVIRYRDGQVTADFAEYDRAAERYFEEFHFPFTYTPGIFYLFGWGHPPASRFGEAPYEGAYPYEDADRGKLRPEYRKAYQACLRAYWEHMKERGWSDRCVLYISDEPFDREPEIREQMKALCAMIHAVDPAIPIYSSTWHHQPDWDGSLGVWGVGHYGVVPPELLGSIRSTGARVWFTTDGQMCTDTPLCAVERLLPRYCFHLGAEAYEFWGCTWLTYDPYEFGWHRFIHQSSSPGESTWVRYPNGDGYLAYPGRTIGHDGPVSSIRLEAARDGVEEYEHLHLLRELIARARERGIDAGEEEQALEESRALVPVPNAGGRYSTRILSDVTALERSRERVARGVVRLGRLLRPRARADAGPQGVDPDLQASLEEAERSIAEELGIPDDLRACGLLDLDGGRTAMVRPDALFYGASVPKIAILLSYLETHPEAATGIDPEVERELQLMIKRSSNELAAKYSQLVGLERIQQVLQSERYRLYDPKLGGGLWCGKHYGIPEPRTGDPIGDYSHSATVRQCLRYYAMLERGELVSPQASRTIRRIFEAPGLEFHVESFVKGLRGRDVTMVRKNGLWEDWHLDTARVQHGDRAYVIAGMAHHPRGQEYLARLAAAVDTILCGPTPSKPYVHHLWRSEEAVQIEASFDSPVIEAPHPFNEALLSFNAGVPEGCRLVAQLRVGRTFDDSWSPYLDVVEWGDGPRDRDRTLDFEGGRIDVDYFRSDVRYDRAQYRLIVTPSASVRVASAALCLSDTTGIPHSVPRPRATAAPLPRTRWQRRIPVPPRSQRVEPAEIAGRICSPTSVAMVLEYRGVDRTTRAVVDRVWDPVHEIYGNWPRNVEAAYTFGVPGYLTRFAEWSEVEAAIAAGQPLIASIRAERGQLRSAPYPSTDGHLLVIVGFDAEGRVLVNDPAAPSPETVRRAYSRREMEEVWLRRGGTAYILLRPEP